MGCCEFFVKYILFFANLVFALAGLALLGLGIAVQVQMVQVVTIADVSLEVAPITAMVVGGLVFLISFFGCCGAIRESNCMLVTYSILMLLLMAAKITIAILIFVNLDGTVSTVGRWLDDFFKQDQAGFQEIERTFRCCGPKGAISYLNLSLPDTCCPSSPCTLINAYGGCESALQDFFQTYGTAFAVIMIVVASIELLAVVFGLCMANNARNKSQRA